jgi:hypothetical protein
VPRTHPKQFIRGNSNAEIGVTAARFDRLADIEINNMDRRAEESRIVGDDTVIIGDALVLQVDDASIPATRVGSVFLQNFPQAVETTKADIAQCQIRVFDLLAQVARDLSQ